MDMLGVRTGVTRMSLPMRYWRSTEKSSGSSGNSKKSGRTGGVPCSEAFAKSVYYGRPSVLNAHQNATVLHAPSMEASCTE